MPEPSDLIRIGVVVGMGFLVWWAFVLAGHRTVQRLVRGEGPEAAERLKRVETLWTVIRRTGSAVIAVLTLLTVMALLQIPLAPMVAVGSAVAVAVGFGAQDLVKDVINGFFIIVEGQYRIGDVVRIADIAGKVEDIRMRVTVLRDLDGNVHYIQNGTIEVASNFTQEFAQVVADVGISYGTDLDRAIEVFHEECLAIAADDAWGYAFLEEPKVLGVHDLAESSVVLRAVLKVLPETRWDIRRELLRRVKNRFDAEGVEIPFPHRTLHLGGSGWQEVFGGAAQREG